jgi:hypothetical protein
MVDGWMGDDWFHNGAFRQQNMAYIYDQVATRKSEAKWWTSQFPVNIVLCAPRADADGVRGTRDLAHDPPQPRFNLHQRRSQPPFGARCANPGPPLASPLTATRLGRQAVPQVANSRRKRPRRLTCL